MYKQVTWDITGVCNAQCRLCPSGGKNLLGNLQKQISGIMSPEDFDTGLEYLTNQKLIAPEYTELYLYNWGEPFAHPKFDEMLRVAARRGFVFNLSTNCSMAKPIPDDVLWRLKEVVFSIPGFSQESYDRQHGFNFEKIKDNIRLILEPIKKISPYTSTSLVYHMYQTNLSEVNDAIKFAEENSLTFIPIFAILTGVTLPIYQGAYDLNNLYTENWAKIKATKPATWECPQYDQLVIDENSNVLQCCLADAYVPGKVIGKLKEVDFELLLGKRKKSPVCGVCIKSDTDYLAHNAGQGAWEVINQI